MHMADNSRHSGDWAADTTKLYKDIICADKSVGQAKTINKFVVECEASILSPDVYGAFDDVGWAV